ncbi:MAG: triose-phosphate isomerase [Clostridiales bacterium]|nr:triose-phosphate isomerase [Clostridiales bacterium]
MRNKIIVGNWKMNNSSSESLELVKKINDLVVWKSDVEVVVCPPSVYIATTVKEIKGIKGCQIKVGAQNGHFESKGAFTGEISCAMLIDVGVEYVVVGHSERRQYFGETDEVVNKRALCAIKSGLTPIVCVGETLAERENSITEEIIRKQVKLILNGISENEIEKVIIAYEPIWAIGTGKTATNEQANEVCKSIRNLVYELYGEKVSEAIRIQYGGSMNGENARELLSQSEIDGGLVGGASLKAEEFSKIVNSAHNDNN